MRRKLFILIAMLISFISASAFAYEGEHTEKRMVVGGSLNLGFAMTAGRGYEELSRDASFGALSVDRNDRTAKFSVGANAYFDFYFTPMFAVNTGFGFLSKGIRFSQGNVKLRENIAYMEIPLCIKLDYRHFQAAAGFALFIALSGKTTVKDDSEKHKYDWTEDNRWQYYHRANFGPKLTFSYAIPAGPLFVVPGISWSIHLINDLDDDEIHNDNPLLSDDKKYKMRANNLMFNVGVEWGF